MHLRFLRIACFITLFFVVNGFGQTSSSPNDDGEKWTRIETDAQELSLAFPPNYIVDAEKKKFGSSVKIFGFANDVTMEIAVSKAVSNKELNFTASLGTMTSESFTKQGLKGIRAFNDAAEVGMKQTISIAGEKNYYYISVTASDRKKPEIERFLYSIKIKGESLFKSSKAQNYSESSIALSSLKTSPEVIEAFERKFEKKKLKAGKDISPNANQIISYEEYSRPPLLVDQPMPEFRPDFDKMNKSDVSIEAAIKLTLLANGQIGDITIIGSKSNSYIDACVDAAKKIRFIPAQKNGVDADSVKIINFSISVFKNLRSEPGIVVPSKIPF